MLYNMSADQKTPVTSKNSKLGAAKRAKKDEFYTPIEAVQDELSHYKHHFADKTVFCNCDDPFESAFFTYFMLKFNDLGLKRLIGMSYGGSAIVGGRIALQDIAGLDEVTAPKEPYEIVLDSVPDDVTTIEDLIKSDPTLVNPLSGDGGFESEDSIARLREADIVVTNPPFSRFRDYVAQLVEHKKQFLLLGNTNAITYKEIWPLIQKDRLWTGVSTFNTGVYFYVNDGFEYAPTYKFERSRNGRPVCRVSNICWFTNMDHSRRHEEIPLWARYRDTPEKYPRYDNFDAIEVSKVNEIPEDYDDLMGVPITFLGKHNPEQFEIVGTAKTLAKPMKECVPQGHTFQQGGPAFYIPIGPTSHRRLYDRIVIRRK